ncbi:MAG TPA: hypothetical protein VF736_02255 [Pyrinomonadaceae bacterium]|jgi:hypothetical protein
MAQHLIHVGYPKAGSTLLQAWFERHPELCYKPGGLGGFCNVYEIARSPGGIWKYHVTSYEGLSMPHQTEGGVDVAYGVIEPDTHTRTRETQARVCSLLTSLYPGSRVLVTTRGFKGMIVSSYSQYVKMGGTQHLGGMCRELGELLQKDAMHYFDYDSMLGLYAGAFGEENLIVLPYELLRDDQGKFLSVLEERLGLTHAEIRLGRLNPSLSPEELYWYPLISRAVSAAVLRLGPSRRRKLYGWYVRKTLGNRLRALIKVLGRVRPGGRVTGADFPAELLAYFEGKAARLKDDPLYAPYAAEYLWDS